LEIKQGLKLKEGVDPYMLFLVSMMKISPDILFSPVKLGGATHGIPMPVTEKKKNHVCC